MHAARPREKEKQREREFGQRLIGAKGARAVDTTRHARQTGRAAWDDVDITIRLPNSNIASTGVGECCAARSLVRLCRATRPREIDTDGHIA